MNATEQLAALESALPQEMLYVIDNAKENARGIEDREDFDRITYMSICDCESFVEGFSTNYTTGEGFTSEQVQNAFRAAGYRW